MTAVLAENLPVVDADTAPFWAAAARHELTVQQCAGCARFVFAPRALCPACGSDQLRWTPCSGRATVYSFTVVHQAQGEFAEQVPFVVALVDLEEGVRMMTRIVGVAPGDVRVGAPVEVEFIEVADGVSLPCFHPAPTATR